MNPMLPEEAAYIHNKSLDLASFLEAMQTEATKLQHNSGLPDFYEHQNSGHPITEKIGYKIEDIEISLANISQEISDALNGIEKLQKELKKILTK